MTAFLNDIKSSSGMTINEQPESRIASDVETPIFESPKYTSFNYKVQNL